MPCKLVCAAALNRLAIDNIKSFDEVHSQRWDELAQDAIVAVKAKDWQFEPRWLNPDVVGSKDGFKEQSRISFQEQLSGILLAPSNRAGQRYCADFQRGNCANEDPCRLGIHRCAAVFKGGRTCHRNHAGSECWDRRKQSRQQTADQRIIVQSVANTVNPAGRGTDKSVRRILPREVNLGGSSSKDAGPTRSAIPGSANKGPKARARCASGRGTGSYGVSTREESHSTVEDKPVDRDNSPPKRLTLEEHPTPQYHQLRGQASQMASS